MPHEHEYEGNGRTGFMLGLLTGTVLGAGIGMLFAPRAGSELRHQISEAAGEWRHNAGEQWNRTSQAAGRMADRGREIYDRARHAVGRGAEEARRYAAETAREATGGTPAGEPQPSAPPGSTSPTLSGSERLSPGGTRS